MWFDPGGSRDHNDSHNKKIEQMGEWVNVAVMIGMIPIVSFLWRQ